LHFDTQNLLENGTARPYGREVGWLNAALGSVERTAGQVPAGALGFALGQSIPLLLRGPAQVGSWSPSRLPVPDTDLLERWRGGTEAMRCSDSPSRLHAKRRP